MTESRARRAVRWVFGAEGTVALDRELQVVMVMTAVGVSGVFVVSPIVSALSTPFGVSDAEAGQLVTAFVAPSILLVPLMGVLADRIGRKPVVVAGLVVFGAAGVAVGLTSSFAIALGLRAVQGLGYAAIIPIGTALIGDLYAGSREATAQGLRVASIQTTNFLSPALAGVLVLASWRFPFFLYGLAFAVAVAAWWELPETDADAVELRPYVRELLALLSDTVIASVLLTFLVRFLLVFSFFAYVSVLLSRTVGAPTVVIGAVVSLFALVSLVTATQAGRLVESRDPLVVLAAALLVTGLGIALMGVLAVYPGLVLGVVVAGVGAGLSGPTQKSLVTQLAPRSLRAGAVSAAVIFQSVGSAAGPFLMGLALDGFPVTVVFAVFGAACAAAGAGVVAVGYLASSGERRAA
jgi:predicted MFS family arabinose efflux permease